MTRPCLICIDPRVQAVDALLAGGRSARSLAIELGLPPEALKRHVRNHQSLHVVSAVIQPPPTGADPLGELVAALRMRALAGSDAASREYRLGLASLAARGAERPDYDVLADARWIRLRTILLDAFADDPAARLRLADAIRRGESS